MKKITIKTYIYDIIISVFLLMLSLVLGLVWHWAVLFLSALLIANIVWLIIGAIKLQKKIKKAGK